MTTPTIQIVALPSDTPDTPAWQQVYHLALESQKESNPHDPVPSVAFMKMAIQQNFDNPDLDIELLAAADGDTMVGYALYATFTPQVDNYEESQHVSFGDAFVTESHRRQGIGSQLMREVIARCEQRGATIFQGDVHTDSGIAFAEQYGGSVAIMTRTNRVAMADLDWAMIDRWREDCTAKNPTVTIETFNNLIDEDERDTYTRFYSEVMNQQPFEDLEGVDQAETPESMARRLKNITDMNGDWVTKISREADGTISGMTEIFFIPERGHRISQGLTGVGEQYRGRSLGKWLKAEMFAYIRENYPDVQYVTTTNANTNAAMLSINERLGFELYKQRTMFKFQLADFAAKLNS